MKPILLIFILVFILITFLLFKYSYNYFKQVSSDNMWRLQGLLLISLGITTVTLLLVKTII